MKMSGVIEDDNEIQTNLSFNNLGMNNDIKNFSLTDLPIFCTELERIIDYIKNSTNIEYFLYDYPVVLERELKDSIIELECILEEIKHTNLNIHQQKKQEVSFRKEKVSLKKTLKKLKENEIREMERVISLFDKAMFTRWENIKSTRKTEALERFLSDITSKQIALDNLNVLVSRKLENLKKLPKSNLEKKNEAELSVIKSVTDSSQEKKIPPPPPLPLFPTWSSTIETVRIESLDELD